MIPLYVHAGLEAAFAVAHVPTRRVGTTGVILCPPVGWDELCSHRVRRDWAEAIADAGHVAVRLDYPGTGDSPGTSRSPDRISAAVDAVGASAALLRERFGCRRVCAIGIGFGGTAAWLATHRGAEIDDLVLWGANLQGRRLVREWQAAARLSIDPRVDQRLNVLGGHAESSDGDGFVDDAGQHITAQTLQGLKEIDLREAPLPDPPGRRVLVFERRGSKPDQDLVQHVGTTGATVTVADGDAFASVMRYVQESRTPHAVIQRSLAWLEDASAHTAPDRLDRGDIGHRAPGASAVFIHDGVKIRETQITATLAGVNVVGVVAQPVGEPLHHATIVFLSGGSDRRIGPNRLWVEQSRKWAARGLTAVRFDQPGVGDSGGDRRALDHLSAHYESRRLRETSHLLDQLAGRGLPNQFVLLGFCSGGYRSVHCASRDQRVIGALAIGFPFFKWNWWTINVRDSWLNVWNPKPESPRAKVILGRTLQRALRVVQRVQHRVVRGSQIIPSRWESILRELDARGTAVTILSKPGSLAEEQLELPARIRRLQVLDRLTVKPVPGADLRFRPLALQAFVKEEMDALIMRAVGAPRREEGMGYDAAATSPLLVAIGGRHH